MKVAIATKNNAKIEGAKRALNRYFDDIEIFGVAVPSEVSDQPINEDLYLGAKNRVDNLKKFCKKENIEADMYLSIESGLIDLYGEWVNTNIAVVENGVVASIGTSPSFPVPKRYVEEIIKTDLGQVSNKIFGNDDERHNRGGTVLAITNGEVSRIDLTESAFVMALTRFVNEKWN